MKPISNIVYQIQYLSILFIFDLQEIIYEKVRKNCYMSADEVGFGDLSIDVFLGIQNKQYS